MDTTLKTLFSVFLDLRKTELAHSTRDIYKYALQRLIESVGDVEVHSITPIVAMTFAANLAEGSKAVTTANMYLRAIKAFFHWLVAADVIGKNPFSSVKFQRETHIGKELYSAAQIERILAMCYDDRWRLIVMLAVSAGLRRGEILNLTVSEIDYAAGIIIIKPKQATATTWPWTIKDGESRTVPITPAAERLLLRVHANLPEGQPYLCLTPTRYRRLIKLQGVGRMTPAMIKCPENNFLRGFTAICRRAGVKYRSFHATRGTGLSIMADNGLHPHELQAIAGHSDVRTTYNYYVRPQAHIDNARKTAFGR